MSRVALLTSKILILFILSGGYLNNCREQTSGTKRKQNADQARQSKAPESEKHMDTQFETAVSSIGQTYLQAERALINGGSAAVTTLTKNLQHSDPIVQFTAKTLLDWIQGKGQEIEAALSYLDNLPKRLAPTPIPAPSPLGVASFLEKHFSSRVADALALRLIKQTDWPHWRVMGVLFYLMNQRLPTTTAALVRFAAETQNEEWRKAAIEALKTINDPDLKQKIALEEQRFKRENKDFPQDLSGLVTP